MGEVPRTFLSAAEIDQLEQRWLRRIDASSDPFDPLLTAADEQQLAWMRFNRLGKRVQDSLVPRQQRTVAWATLQPLVEREYGHLAGLATKGTYLRPLTPELFQSAEDAKIHSCRA